MEDEEKEAIRQALLKWKSEGVANPTIPYFKDSESPVGYYGLTHDDQLSTGIGSPEAIIVTSVFESTGEGAIND